jgi:hypothetical protein
MNAGAGVNGTGYTVESPLQDYPTSERSLTIMEQQQHAVEPSSVGLGIGFVLPAGASAPAVVGGRATVG